MSEQEKRAENFQQQMESYTSPRKAKRAIVLSYTVIMALTGLTALTYINYPHFFKEMIAASTIISGVLLMRIQELKSIK